MMMMKHSRCCCCYCLSLAGLNRITCARSTSAISCWRKTVWRYWISSLTSTLATASEEWPTRGTVAGVYIYIYIFVMCLTVACYLSIVVLHARWRNPEIQHPGKEKARSKWFKSWRLGRDQRASPVLISFSILFILYCFYFSIAVDFDTYSLWNCDITQFSFQTYLFLFLSLCKFIQNECRYWLHPKTLHCMLLAPLFHDVDGACRLLVVLTRWYEVQLIIFYAFPNTNKVLHSDFRFLLRTKLPMTDSKCMYSFRYLESWRTPCRQALSSSSCGFALYGCVCVCTNDNNLHWC